MAAIICGIFLPLLIILVVVITRQWQLTNRRKKSKLPIPPGPKPWPLVGSFPEIFRSGKPAFRWIHNFMDEMKTEIACIRLGGTYVIPVTSPELAREFLKNQGSVFASRPVCMSADLISNGYQSSIFLPPGDKWMKMRKVLHSHVLSPAALHWLHDKRAEEANNLVKYIYTRCCNKISGTGAGGMHAVNVRIVSRQYCGNVISKMVFNKRFFGNGEEEEELLKAMFALLQTLYGFGVSDHLPWLSIFDIDGYKGIIKKAMSVMRKHLDTEVDKRVQMWKDGIKTVEQDILDVLLTLKDNAGTPLLSDTEIKTQVLEMMLATTDNPSNAVEWALAEMINQPKLLEKAVEEIDNVVGRERLVEESDLPKLNYVKACIKEAFRLHPVAPFNIPHVSLANTVVGGYYIPKGSQVLLSRVGLGRNAKAWEEPMMFKPERHLKEGGGEVDLNDSELKLLAFSTGSRGCPAVKLGSLMTTMLMARLLQSFTWNLPPTLPCRSLTEAKDDLFLENPLLASSIFLRNRSGDRELAKELLVYDLILLLSPPLAGLLFESDQLSL
ncbi:PREDICTED: isoleucine N-monooxygenase 1-like [Ipomoea nil]|uniref:isoleucine N-monooxygenase 1-like n=1 Tax=Ipomoea nil TaxID=35883 RepID=UPI000901AF65|nr:PREDICTED: isoleucine N-monooxygenase 1-like [Ipomoea nil]